MGSSDPVLKRMKERVTQLSGNFSEYVDQYELINTFTGPSYYFHQKTLAIRRKYSSAVLTMKDEFFFDYLYATLTAWGLHRMGQTNTKLGDIEKLKDSFITQTPEIRQIEALKITDLSKTDTEQITGKIWYLISRLKVSIAEAKIVANSKALHHLLPDLVPPIDRTYTYNFFYNRTMLSIAEEEAFQEMYLQFHRLAVANRDNILCRLGKGWNTSETKIIDNAIVGYVIKNL